MSKKGIEPSRNYPHEPESCASTSSATSTSVLPYVKNFIFSSYDRCSWRKLTLGQPSRKTILNCFARQSATSTSVLPYVKNFIFSSLTDARGGKIFYFYKFRECAKSSATFLLYSLPSSFAKRFSQWLCAVPSVEYDGFDIIK